MSLSLYLSCVRSSELLAPMLVTLGPWISKAERRVVALALAIDIVCRDTQTSGICARTEHQFWLRHFLKLVVCVESFALGSFVDVFKNKKELLLERRIS